MIAVFWSAMLVTLYTYLLYPVLVWVRSRFQPRPWLRLEIRPSLSVVLAVHNGETLIEKKLEHLLSLDYPAELIDVIVVSDGSTDNTAAILGRMSHPRLQSVILEAQKGKAAALNAGIARARGDLVLFVDIRPWLEPAALKRIVSNFADPKVGCAAGELLLRQEGHDETAAAVAGLYWRYEQWTRHCEAAVDSATSFYGGFYAARRELIAPFPEGLILDDMFQPISVVRQGYRAVSDPAAKVWDVWPKSTKGEFQRKVRTLAGNFQLLQMCPWILSRSNRLRLQLISHKFLRLLVPFLLPVLLLSSWSLRENVLYWVFCLAQVCFYAIAALGLTDISPLRRIGAPAAAFLVLNAAVVVGFYKFWFFRGPLWKIWTRPAGAGANGSSH